MAGRVLRETSLGDDRMENQEGNQMILHHRAVDSSGSTPIPVAKNNSVIKPDKSYEDTMDMVSKYVEQYKGY